MNDYKPNSHRYKAEQKELAKESGGKKKVAKVVKGKVRTKKKNEVHKLADVFIAEDASNVKSYIFLDVLVPAIKKAISDIVRDGIDMVLYGDAHKRSGSGASYVSYRDYGKRGDGGRSSSNRVKSRYDFDDIILESRGEAEDVLSRMDELIETYGIVSVADLYDLVGISCNYTDNRYGWTSVHKVDVVRERDGYRLKMPKVMPID